MKVQDQIEEIRRNPGFSDVGMMVSHNGVVRSFARGGQPTKGLTVRADWEAIDKIRREIKERPGILEVLIHVEEGARKVGDDVLIVTVGGDIRENVFPALIDAVNRVKKEALEKEEDLEL